LLRNKIAHHADKQTHHTQCGEPTLAARCSQPLSTNQTPHPTTKAWGDNQSLSPVSHTRDEEIAGLLSQSPIVCLAIPSPQIPLRLNVCRAPEPHPLQMRPIQRIAQITELPHDAGGSGSRGAP